MSGLSDGGHEEFGLHIPLVEASAKGVEWSRRWLAEEIWVVGKP